MVIPVSTTISYGHTFVKGFTFSPTFIILEREDRTALSSIGWMPIEFLLTLLSQLSGKLELPQHLRTGSTTSFS